MFNSKEQIASLTAQVALYEKFHDEQKEQIDKLQGQVERLQDSLMAASHPEAYRQVKDDQYMDSLPEEPREGEEEQRERMRIQKEFIDNLEGPTFRDADDVMEMLTRSVGTQVATEPIHPNEES